MRGLRPAALIVHAPHPLRDWQPQPPQQGGGGGGGGLYLVPARYMRPLPGRPADWSKEQDGEGRKVYRNRVTGQS